jgi:GWxTD domain-containing protein
MFAKLTTDKDRERFIQEFWERRNPKPGRPDNAFERKYYARLAYTKQHFHYLAMGTRDDRARIYILYGPPDRIEQATPQNEKQTGIKETWIYNRIEGIGDHIAVQFADALGSAEYRVVNDPEALRRPSG